MLDDPGGSMIVLHNNRGLEITSNAKQRFRMYVKRFLYRQREL